MGVGGVDSFALCKLGRPAARPQVFQCLSRDCLNCDLLEALTHFHFLSSSLPPDLTVDYRPPPRSPSNNDAEDHVHFLFPADSPLPHPTFFSPFLDEGGEEW